MLFTRAERYALRCILHLAENSRGSLATLEDIAAEQGISRQYMANIMCHLSAAGLVHTYRGLHGGYSLGRPVEQITAADIWDAVRSADAPINCIIDNAECPSVATCPIRKLFEKAFDELHSYLGQWTIRDLSAELKRLHMPATCGQVREKKERRSTVGKVQSKIPPKRPASRRHVSAGLRTSTPH